MSADADSAPIPSNVAARRAGGQLLSFRRSAAGTHIADPDVTDALTRVADANGFTSSWLYTDIRTGIVETYDRFGFLQTVSRATGGGFGTYLIWQNGSEVAYGLYDTTNSRVLLDTRDNQNRATAIRAYTLDPPLANFAYDASNNLISITWPDASVRRFVYEDPRWPNSLTGIIDESNVRFASWTYDDKARAISSTHAGGVGAVTIAYTATTSTTTDTLGGSRTRTLSVINGVTKSTSQSQVSGSGCPASSSASSFDANGVVSQDVVPVEAEASSWWLL